MKRYLVVLAFLCPYLSMCQPIKIRGEIIDEQNNPVAGATVVQKRTGATRVSDAEGRFSFESSLLNDTIVVSALHFETEEVVNNERGELRIILKRKIRSLQEVVVNTGYQQLRADRATGSYTTIDKGALNEQVSTGIINRLEGITNAIQFDKHSNRPPITIRGFSTINGDKDPLIILDNFPYEGNISNIHPNDVESVTILKDAAASSIWGTRAGNGVIVITTKKGSYNQPLKMGFNSNFSFSEKPDLHYLPIISSADFIEAEQFLFSKGYYNNQLTNLNRPVLSPAVEILARQRAGNITAAEAEEALDVLRSIDVRNQFDKYVYKTATNKQYALNLSGGSNMVSWYLSGGLDKNSNNLGAPYERRSLRSETRVKITRKMQLSSSVHYVNSETGSGRYGYDMFTSSLSFPYTSIADENGRALAVPKFYRSSYIDTAGGGKLLDWNYYFMDDHNHSIFSNNLQHLLLQANLQYKLPAGFDVDLKFQYGRQEEEIENLQTLKSFGTRDIINRFTQINRSTGAVSYKVPPGDILDRESRLVKSRNLRAQLNYNLTRGAHELHAFIGNELREAESNGSYYRIFGYNEENLSFANVDLVNSYPTYITGAMAQIPGRSSNSGKNNRFVSYYGNAGYTFLKKYTLTVSARRDASNLFGLHTNDKWTPLWSAGAAWNLSDESFYKFAAVPVLRVRLTYGYSGNADPSKSSVTTISYSTFPADYTNYTFASVRQHPNPSLRWEQVGTLNMGTDFQSKHNRLSGAIDYYIKKGQDLFGAAPIDYSSGLGNRTVTRNVANITTKGIDVTLSANVIDKIFKWAPVIHFSFNRSKVGKYHLATTNASNHTSNGAVITAMEGQPVYAIISFRTGGLDSSGNPQGIIDGQHSINYNSLMGTGNKIEDLVYSGSATPEYFGSFINRFAWKGLSLSVNVTYKLGHYFRRESISYSQLMSLGKGHGDYALRWKAKGDEANTTVPGFIYPNSSLRDAFYNTSEVLVEKADHIRLQYINLNYTLNRRDAGNKAFKQVQVYTVLSNLGILWRANEKNIDPDYGSNIPPSRSIAFGINYEL